MPGMWDVSGGGIIGGPPSEPAQTGEVTSVGGSLAACGIIKGILPAFGGDSGVPGQGLQCGSMIRVNLQVHFLHCHVQA